MSDPMYGWFLIAVGVVLFIIGTQYLSCEMTPNTPKQTLEPLNEIASDEIEDCLFHYIDDVDGVSRVMKLIKRFGTPQKQRVSEADIMKIIERADNPCSPEELAAEIAAFVNKDAL